MDTVCPRAPGTRAGWVRDGSRRPVLGAVYTRMQGAGGMRRGDETVQGPARSPWASCGASRLGVSAPAHSHHGKRFDLIQMFCTIRDRLCCALNAVS